MLQHRKQEMIDSLESGLAKERMALSDNQKARRDFMAAMFAGEVGIKKDDFVRAEGRLWRVAGFILAKENRYGFRLRLDDYYEELPVQLRYFEDVTLTNK